MDEEMEGRKDGWVNGCMDRCEWVGEWMDGWVDEELPGGWKQPGTHPRKAGKGFPMR